MRQPRICEGVVLFDRARLPTHGVGTTHIAHSAGLSCPLLVSRLALAVLATALASGVAHTPAAHATKGDSQLMRRVAHATKGDSQLVRFEEYRRSLQSRVRLVFSPLGTTASARLGAGVCAKRVGHALHVNLDSVIGRRPLRLWLDLGSHDDLEPHRMLTELGADRKGIVERLQQGRPILSEEVVSPIPSHYMDVHRRNASGRSHAEVLRKLASADPCRSQLMNREIPRLQTALKITDLQISVEHPYPDAYVELVRSEAAHQAFTFFREKQQDHDAGIALLYSLFYKYLSAGLRDHALALAIKKAHDVDEDELQVVVRNLDHAPTLQRFLETFDLEPEASIVPRDIYDVEDVLAELYSQYATARVANPAAPARSPAIAREAYQRFTRMMAELGRRR